MRSGAIAPGQDYARHRSSEFTGRPASCYAIPGITLARAQRPVLASAMLRKAGPEPEPAKTEVTGSTTLSAI